MTFPDSVDSADGPGRGSDPGIGEIGEADLVTGLFDEFADYFIQFTCIVNK
jgi:hypothetical protein